MIITTDEALGVYGVLDCGAWVNNFMLAARSLGIASIAQAALGSAPESSYALISACRRTVWWYAGCRSVTRMPPTR